VDKAHRATFGNPAARSDTDHGIPQTGNRFCLSQYYPSRSAKNATVRRCARS
jgi:hypothetical protein